MNSVEIKAFNNIVNALKKLLAVEKRIENMSLFADKFAAESVKFQLYDAIKFAEKVLSESVPKQDLEETAEQSFSNELKRGEDAALVLVDHLETMCAASCELPVEKGGKRFVVSVRAGEPK